jgi:predicted HicB family RNase H-like nuclease
MVFGKKKVNNYMNILKYKGYDGTSEIDMEQMVCRGKILFIDDVVTYKADSPKELQQEFEEAVDDYLDTCAYLNREPQKPLKGQFNVRITPALHKAATNRALEEDLYLNDIVSKAIDSYVNGIRDINHNITIEVSGDKGAIKTYAATAATETTWEDQTNVQ